jgi:hypothetical protein
VNREPLGEAAETTTHNKESLTSLKKKQMRGKNRWGKEGYEPNHTK